jgi:peptide methionine sulfoxide reductase MsrA
MNPTYHSLGNHTEAVEIDFDPKEISFSEVLALIWKSHNPIGARRSNQYKSAIWFANDQQRDAIKASIEPLQRRYQRPLTTEVLPRATFFLAEDYHQKYVLQRHDRVMKKFNLFYPNFEDFINSTAAARLNGLAYGSQSKDVFDQEQAQYGFTLDELTPLRR